MLAFEGTADVANSRCQDRPGLTFCYNKIRRFPLRLHPPAEHFGRIKSGNAKGTLSWIQPSHQRKSSAANSLWGQMRYLHNSLCLSVVRRRVAKSWRRQNHWSNRSRLAHCATILAIRRAHGRFWSLADVPFSLLNVLRMGAPHFRHVGCNTFGSAI